MEEKATTLSSDGVQKLENNTAPCEVVYAVLLAKPSLSHKLRSSVSNAVSGAISRFSSAWSSHRTSAAPAAPPAASTPAAPPESRPAPGGTASRKRPSQLCSWEDPLHSAMKDAGDDLVDAAPQSNLGAFNQLIQAQQPDGTWILGEPLFVRALITCTGCLGTSAIVLRATNQWADAQRFDDTAAGTLLAMLLFHEYFVSRWSEVALLLAKAQLMLQRKYGWDESKHDELRAEL